ncbi:zinc ABC transporter ATP-binding protein ZnuC [Aurantivibrio plasticivorans]
MSRLPNQYITPDKRLNGTPTIMNATPNHPTAQPLIEASSIGFTRHKRDILRNANLQVYAKELVTLIGPNGAGKSTLIRILLGLLKPDAGRVIRRPDLRIGYMPQKVSIDPTLPLTVKGFLGLAGGDRNAVSQALALTDASHLENYAMQSLSGGEMQRVLLSRALYRKPHLLVLDEPVQGVDVAGQSKLYQLISNLRDELECGVLMVSHDLHIVMAATDRVVCLNQHICCEGHPEAVSTHPEFLQLFGKTEDTGIAIYTHHHDHTHDGSHSHDHACQGDHHA